MTPESVSKIERTYHDAHAAKFDEKKLLKWFKGHHNDRIWKDVVPSLEGHRVLDVGCGLGFDAVLLARNGFDVTGVDISPRSVERSTMLAKLTGTDSRCRFLIADLNSANVDELGRFDVVFGRAVLHHLTVRPLAETLTMLRTNLSRNGRMIFIEPLDKNPVVLLNRRFLDVYDRTPTEKPVNLRETLEAFRMAGFSVTHREYYLTSTLSYFWRNVLKDDKLYRTSENVLVRLDNRLFRAFSCLANYAWISLIVASPRSNYEC
jgi:2-polyprenyl-3-methyl-5-hydroxy-6-metoxy-1,4-benzoquinol methylase